MRSAFNLAQALLPIAELAMRIVVAVGHSIRFLYSIDKLMVGEMIPALVGVTCVLHPVTFNSIPVHFLPHLDNEVPVALSASQNAVAAMPAINGIDNDCHFHPAHEMLCALQYVK
jgi:hypothetical protein